MNNINLVGRLTKDPERNNKCVKFTLAVDRFNSSTKEKEADFIPCVAFAKTQEVIMNYCHKGSKVAINGSLKSGQYQNSQGNTVYTLDVWVASVELIETSRNQQAQPQQQESQQATYQANNNYQQPSLNDVGDDDIPF